MVIETINNTTSFTKLACLALLKCYSDCTIIVIDRKKGNPYKKKGIKSNMEVKNVSSVDAGLVKMIEELDLHGLLTYFNVPKDLEKYILTFSKGPKYTMSEVPTLMFHYRALMKSRKGIKSLVDDLAIHFNSFNNATEETSRLKRMVDFANNYVETYLDKNKEISISYLVLKNTFIPLVFFNGELDIMINVSKDGKIKYTTGGCSASLINCDEKGEVIAKNGVAKIGDLCFNISDPIKININGNHVWVED